MASLARLDGWIALGQRVRRHIRHMSVLAGAAADPEFVPRFRHILHRPLRIPHHMQAAMPGLNVRFQELHRRRKREGRLGQYANTCFGKEYPQFEGQSPTPCRCCSTPLGWRERVGGSLCHTKLLPDLVRNAPGDAEPAP